MRRISLVSIVALLLLGACAKGGGTGAGSTGDSGVRGQVVLGPSCPVELVDSPCPPRPLSTDIRVTRSGEEVTTVRSGSDGTFTVALPPGDYLLQPTGFEQGNYPFAKPLSVTVKPGEFTTVTLTVDTGIR